MNIITVSRQFGSGGRELAKRMADILEYDYYDNEILSQLAHKKGIDEAYASSLLTSGAKNVAVTFGRTFTGAVSGNAVKTELLVAQKEIIESIAALGRNCIIVGRCADVILKDKNPLNIFVCADINSRIDRCASREEDTPKSRKEYERIIRSIDKERAWVRSVMSSGEWGSPLEYDLVVNSSNKDIKRLAEYLTQYAKEWFLK